VAVIGANGKSGMLCCYQARQKAGPDGSVIAIVHREQGKEDVENAPFIDRVIVVRRIIPQIFWGRWSNRRTVRCVMSW
jgi:hypothetical protein